jgi:O-antigen/teichoic acid export membrane protein
MSFPARELLSYSVPLVVHDITAVLLTAAGTILLAALRSDSEVATLRAVMPVALTLTYVLSTFGVLFAPLASRLRARSDPHEVNRIYWQTAAWTGLFSLPVFLLGSIFAQQLTLFLFGARYADAATILALLVAGYFSTCLAGPNGVLLAVYGEVRYVVVTNVVAVVVNIALGIVLISAFGALGAAIATSATVIALNVSWQVGLARRTEVRGLDRQYVRLWGLMAAAAAALLAVRLLVAPAFGVALVLVVVAWAAVLLGARRSLTIADTFAEIGRIPVLRRILRPEQARL